MARQKAAEPATKPIQWKVENDTITLQELAEMPGYTVGTRIAAKLLGTTGWALSCAAKQGVLGLPFVFCGNRLKISKAALLEYCGYKPSEKKED